jgi:hypothetical protein
VQRLISISRDHLRLCATGDAGVETRLDAGISPFRKEDQVKSDEEKAVELLKKRRLAAKGLKERPDGKAVDPLEDMTSLDPDDKRTEVDALDPSAPRRPAGVGAR